MQIILTVTTDLNYDQRMIRICTSLKNAGHDVKLVGRKRRFSLPLMERNFRQKRIFCFFDKGKLFYLEYNFRLFFYLLFQKMDIICAIDLDTILPVLYVSKIRNKARVYDAHELFCEMDEIVSRPNIYKIWKWIERNSVPHFKHGYTIGDCYADEFKKLYDVDYKIVRNATVLKKTESVFPAEKYILYQGAVNEGRCFETLIPAMKQVDCKMIIVGDGNFYEQAKALVIANNLESKIKFEGYVAPEKLIHFTLNACIGITLFSNQGQSNYLSMANRFFDYMHAGIPQLCVGYPEYKKVNEQFEISFLINEIDSDSVAKALNELLTNDTLYKKLKSNCILAREEYCWQKQEEILHSIYNKINE